MGVKQTGLVLSLAKDVATESTHDPFRRWRKARERVWWGR